MKDCNSLIRTESQDSGPSSETDGATCGGAVTPTIVAFPVLLEQCAQEDRPQDSFPLRLQIASLVSSFQELCTLNPLGSDLYLDGSFPCFCWSLDCSLPASFLRGNLISRKGISLDFCFSVSLHNSNTDIIEILMLSDYEQRSQKNGKQKQNR